MMMIQKKLKYINFFSHAQKQTESEKKKHDNYILQYNQ